MRRLREPRVGVGQWSIGLTALVLLCSACSGGSSGPGVAGASSSASARPPARGPIAFAACMRSHGVPNFPDPSITAQGDHLMVGMDLSRIDTSSPQFQTALKACQGLPGRLPIGVGQPVGNGGSAP